MLGCTLMGGTLVAMMASFPTVRERTQHWDDEVRRSNFFIDRLLAIEGSACISEYPGSTHSPRSIPPARSTPSRRPTSGRASSSRTSSSKRGIVGEFAGATRAWKLSTYGLSWRRSSTSRTPSTRLPRSTGWTCGDDRRPSGSSGTPRSSSSRTRCGGTGSACSRTRSRGGCPGSRSGSNAAGSGPRARSTRRCYGGSSGSPRSPKRCFCPLDDLDSAALAYAEAHGIGGAATFAIRVKRSGKHAFRSPEKAADLGGVILEAHPDLQVDLGCPDFELYRRDPRRPLLPLPRGRGRAGRSPRRGRGDTRRALLGRDRLARRRVHDDAAGLPDRAALRRPRALPRRGRAGQGPCRARRAPGLRPRPRAARSGPTTTWPGPRS